MKKAAVLVHGLGRTSFSMLLLGTYLKRHGFTVLYYSYNSARDILDGHFAKFADYLNSIAEKYQDSEIHFVTHSMGGILVRGALTPEIFAKFANPGRIVMLAPPNRGSGMATRLSKYKIIGKILKPLQELSDTPDSKVKNLPVPESMEIGIITGKFDAKVKPEEAILDGTKEYLTVNAAHTFIMNRHDVMKAVLNFLNSGKFNSQKE